MSITSKENFYSYHVFLFPFKWGYNKQDQQKTTLDEQMDIRDFCQLIEAAPDWKNNTLSVPPPTIPLYNEMSYFHDFARKALYDFGEQDSFLRHFEYQLDPQKNEYIIHLKDKIYRLDLDSILLNVYNTGVGMLSFHLYNREENQSSPSDILNINQYGRRLFHPFLQNKWTEIGNPAFFQHNDFIGAANEVKGYEIAHKIDLLIGDRLIEEDFEPRKNPMELGQLPNFIRNILPPNFFHHILLEHTIDDQMFVLSWYNNQTIARQVKKKTKKEFVSDHPFYAYKTLPWWYKYVFVDANDMTCKDEQMVFDMMSKHTNSRWVENGTLFGVSRYSFVSVTDFPSDFRLVAAHTMSMYYKLVELSLVQRASILRFSDEVADISKLDPGNKKSDRKRLSAKVSSLYRQYIRFVNKIYFREVTAQDQGIELYDLLQEHMRIERDVKDLDAEIQELYQYASMVEETRQNDTVELLTFLGALFIVPGFIVGYLGMNIFDFKDKTSIELPANFYLFVIVACILSVAAIYTYHYTTTKWKKIALALLLFVVVSAVLFFPMYLQNL